MPLSAVSMLLLLTLAVLTRAEPLCDPETQYLMNGECCQKCKPGTSKVSVGVEDCRNPDCKACDENEYMDTYNTERICERQPYCDLNSNFQRPESTSKTERHQCQCKEGFHCSSASCVTCVPHTKCKPGYWAKTIGDQTHDTVCEKCPNGTFSNETSWKSTCKQKTKCLDGVVSKAGNNDSDDECAPNRLYVGLIVSFVLFVLVVAVVAAVLYKFKCKNRHEPLKVPMAIDPLDDYNSDVCKVAVEDDEKMMPFIANPTEDREELGSPCQETHHSGPPEESEDVVFTFNGDVLSQDGKEHIISQPETQDITIN